MSHEAVEAVLAVAGQGPVLGADEALVAVGQAVPAYRLRAEIPGRFSALPARVGAMYAPELRGNSDELRIRIED